MKCIVCDRCKTIIENPRRCRVITCARPLKPRTTCEKSNVYYRGNDPQQNDIFWEKEICDSCFDELELFFETGGDIKPHPPAPEEPDPDIPVEPDEPGSGGETPPVTGDGDGENKNPDSEETGGDNTQS